ncbi:MAG: hypothetical protein ACUVQG_14995 [Thermogutta sp.]
MARTSDRGKEDFCGRRQAPLGLDADGRLTFTLLYEIALEGNPHRWRFILRASDGHDELVAEDVEPGVHGERLELLTVLRALESLNQPSRIVVWTRSPFLREGFLYGLSEWPLHDWCWERFGQRVPVRNWDLWQRIERVARFHEVECRAWRFDPPHVHEVNAANAVGRFHGLFSARHKKPRGRERAWALPGRNYWARLFGAFLLRRLICDKPLD